MGRIRKAESETEELFESSAELADHLLKLQLERNKQKKEMRDQRKRETLPKSVRERILRKTGRRCHICGGLIEPWHKWRVDYVLVAGKNSSPVKCGLPAHNTSNNSRCFYSPEELKWIFKLGIWFRGQIAKKSPPALKLANRFVKYEKRRIARTSRKI